MLPIVVNYKYIIRWGSVVCLVLIGGLVFVVTLFRGKSNQVMNALFYHYHSPGLLITSIILFSFFLTFKFKSGIINYLSLSSFAIYLFHEHPYTKTVAYVEFFSNLQVGQYQTILYVIGCGLLIACMAVVVDQPRIWLSRIFGPIFDKVTSRLNIFDK